MPRPGKISRVTRSKKEARAFYDRFSRNYDRWSEGFEGPFRKSALESFEARAGEILLEIGYGTGHAMTVLADAVGDGGRVYGLDISEGMRIQAKKRLQEANLLSRTDLTCGDAAVLPYDDAFFDGIFISFTLELFDSPDLPRILSECRRVLKQEGRLTAVSLSKEKINPMVRLYELFHRLLPARIDCRPILLRSLLEENGFSVTSTGIMKKYGLPIEIITAVLPRSV